MTHPHVETLLGDDGYQYTVRVDPLWAWVFRAWCWHINNHGYCYRSTSHIHSGRKQSHNVYLHRFVKGLDYQDPHEVDHLNNDRLDNQDANLEVVTHAVNMQRRRQRLNEQT